MNMGEQTVPVLLITANVGSVFENVSFCARFISFLIENSFPSEMVKMSLHVGEPSSTVYRICQRIVDFFWRRTW